MITVFDDLQRSHAPREFIVSGKPQPIPEVPERIDMLLDGVRVEGAERGWTCLNAAQSVGAGGAAPAACT